MSAITVFNEPVESLSFPVYAPDFQKAIAKISDSGDRVKKIENTTIFAIDKEGKEVSFKPELTNSGIEFKKVRSNPA